MQRESNQRKLVLELKRRFVRFICHEIRTPLNVVCMGLELLKAELIDRTKIEDTDENNSPENSSRSKNDPRVKVRTLCRLFAATGYTILMDFEMPVMNGPDATKRLRELGCKAAIFGVTGNVLADDVEHFRKHGADHVIPKPVYVSQIDSCWESMET